MAKLRGGVHLRPAHIDETVPLPDVSVRADRTAVYKLQPADADRRKLDCNLSTDTAEPDVGRRSNAPREPRR